MEYFTLTSQEGNPIPRIINWYGKIDVRKLNRQDYKQLPQFILLDMKNGTDILYPDIFTFPFFMVSRQVMEVIRLYQEDMPCIYIALFDTEKGESASYYLPILMDGSLISDEAIYRIQMWERSEIRICIDLAESLLARGAVGLNLNRIDQK